MLYLMATLPCYVQTVSALWFVFFFFFGLMGKNYSVIIFAHIRHDDMLMDVLC